MLKDVVWHKCCEQLPVNDGVLHDIFIILRKVPYAVFTGCYVSGISEIPFYICGIDWTHSRKVLYWADVPDGLFLNLMRRS